MSDHHLIEAMAEESALVSYRIGVIIPGETSNPLYDGLRFATRDEADRYGFDLLSRWFAPERYVIEETEDPVSHVWRDGIGDTAMPSPVIAPYHPHASYVPCGSDCLP